MPQGDASHTVARKRGRRRALLFGLPLLAAALVAALALVDGRLTIQWPGREQSANPSSTPSPGQDAGEEATGDPADLLPDPAPVPTVAEPATYGALDAAQVRAATRPGLRDPDLGRHVVALVADLAGGEPVLAKGTDPVVPASTAKVLTATAALQTVGPATRFSTRVVAGPRPRDLVLVGGGDPYLASKPAEPGTWPERADVRTLARLTADALAAQNVTRVRLGYDSSLFTGPAENPRWRADYIVDEIVAPITALAVDGGRDQTGFGRVEDPARSAADAFAAALRRAGVRVLGEPTETVAPADAAQVAAVESAPVEQIVQRVLDVSDNEAAEVLARHVGLAVSGEASFTAGTAAVLSTLTDLGVDTTGTTLYDGSGLSRANRVPARLLLETLRLAAGPAYPELRPVLAGLPVAGFTGSLTWRFADAPAQGRGRVRAKTGTLTGVHALAGVATGVDNTPMVFVLVADRVALADNLDAREALDQVAASLGACRCGTVG